MKIAVTGTIGSGKSTLCAKLAALLPGFTVVSVDDVVRSIYGDADFLAHLQKDFGVGSRKEASDLVFADPDKRHALEQLSLRYVRPKLAAALEVNNAIVEFPLLFEMSDFATRADLVVAVGCDDATQEARVVARDKMSLEKLNTVRASQYSRELRAALSDVYVDTGLPPEQQERAIATIVARVHEHQLEERALGFFGQDAGPALWQAIRTRYTESQRHYHTLAHLHELFAVLTPHLAGHPFARAIELAVWFHDIVYETSPALYPTNEAQSAKEMLRLLGKHLPTWLRIECLMHAQVYLAAEIIVATKTHKMHAAWVRAKPEHLAAAELFMDADMAILATPQPRLSEYDAQISREWGQTQGLESFEFCSGRFNALRGFKTAGPVFMTTEFQELESAAQANIDHLMDFWQHRLTVLNRELVTVAKTASP